MSISKKLRFEVFKRDGFACQYCGRTPPEVMLEVDHINPRSEGGKDDINNLLTACFDCNRGKSNIELDKIPAKLAENLEVLREREAQLEEYNVFLADIEWRLNREADEVDEVFKSYFKDRELTENFKTVSVRKFLKLLPKSEVIEAMHLACSRIQGSDRAVRYFCGVCWNKIRGPKGAEQDN